MGWESLGQWGEDAIVRMVALERITAAVRSGGTELAAIWVADIGAFARATGRSWAVASANCGRALLADGDEVAEAFIAALSVTGPGLRPYDRARSQLAYGGHLRRSQHRSEARPQLKSALTEFEQLGAGPFIARAANELRASGETARKRDPSTALALTPMELRTAQFAVQSISNRDIAAQLWISPRTVAFHLRNVFTKTGISSRGELGRLRLQ